MNTARKVQLLYQKAHGQGMNASPEELRELKKYKVTAGDGNLATKKNIQDYTKAVDGGYPLSFYDWCQNNLRADRRRKGSSEREMASNNREATIGTMLFGWLTWGLAIYWVAGQTLSVGASAIAGAVLSAVLYHLNRRLAGFTLFLLPIIIMVVAGRR